MIHIPPNRKSPPPGHIDPPQLSDYDIDEYGYLVHKPTLPELPEDYVQYIKDTRYIRHEVDKLYNPDSYSSDPYGTGYLVGILLLLPILFYMIYVTTTPYTDTQPAQHCTCNAEKLDTVNGL